MNSLVIISKGDPAGGEQEQAIARALSDSGFRVWVTPHLYHLSPKDAVWERIRLFDGHIAVFMWLHPRPAEWLLQRRGVLPDRLAATADLATQGTPEKALAFLSEIGFHPDHGTTEQLGRPPLRQRWYPVVDRARCVDCGHCLQFCLFGVFGTTEGGQVAALAEDSCKTGCPACGRVCPNGAIMFPLYARDGAIAGAPGLFATPDGDAKRMFYMRTGAPCALCGQSGQFRRPAGSDRASLCPECGRVKAAKTDPPSAAHAEIDQLIDELDRIAGKGS
jgi:Pyruvate/2-oxoacid:ferredoxin oxidoreductase delta subunit